MTLDDLAVLLVVAMVPFATVAAGVYLLRFPWRRTREGWAFAFVVTSFALLIDLAVLYEFVPSFPGKPLVKVILYAVILLGQIQLAVSLLSVTRAERYRRR